MANFHFIDDPVALTVISTILSLAGANFTPPYDSDSQPSDAVARNEEILTQFNAPGGTTLKSVANPAASPNMSFVISSLLSILAPFMSAYGLILPIIGIIRGIIEVLCCLMNPFCIAAALIRLFIKWLPPFISIFPPLAGVVVLLSVIKLIIALVFFVLTEVVPTIQLIINNIKEGVEAAKAKNLAKVDAIEQKLDAILKDLVNRVGILSAAKPLLDLIFLILQLVSGLPCAGGSNSSKNIDSLPGETFSGLDSNCCSDDMCLPVLENPPNGSGLLAPKFYGDAPRYWSWQLTPITGHENMQELRPYLQDLSSQLNSQLDEDVNEARPIGSQNDAAHFRLKIYGRRADPANSSTAGSVTAPIAQIDNNDRITVTNVNLKQYIGVVNYVVEPNYNQLVGRGIMPIACHPDVKRAKDVISNRFELDVSALDKHPELANLPNEYDNMTNAVNTLKNIPLGLDLDNIDTIQNIQDNLVDTLLDFVNSMKNYLNLMLSRATNKTLSTLDTDKNIVKPDGKDKATIIVVPRDVGGTILGANLPEGVDISVEIFTDFGTIKNKTRDNNTGEITAELISPFAGTANVTAKVNSDYITTFDNSTLVETTKTEQIRFVADAILPKRRSVSRTRTKSGATPEREPGNR